MNVPQIRAPGVGEILPVIFCRGLPACSGCRQTLLCTDPRMSVFLGVIPDLRCRWEVMLPHTLGSQEREGGLWCDPQASVHCLVVLPTAWGIFSVSHTPSGTKY